MLIYRMSFLIMVVFLYASCSKKYNWEQFDYFANHCQDVDSVVEFSKLNSNNQKVLFNMFIRLKNAGDVSKYEELRHKVEKNKNFYSEENNSEFNYLLLIGNLNLWDNDTNNLAKVIEKMTLMKTSDTIDILGFHLLKGSYFYNKKLLVSAKNSFYDGFVLSRNNENYFVFRESFALNLGALAFQTGYYSSASDYFAEAFRINKLLKNENLMLINNLVACYIYENRYQAAIDLLNKYKHIFSKNKYSTESQSLRLNYIICQISVGNLDLADKYLKETNLKLVPNDIKGEYVIQLFRINVLKKAANVDSLYMIYREDILKNYSIFLSRIGDELYKFVCQFPNKSKIILSDLDSIKTEDFNLKSKYFSLLLKYKLKRVEGKDHIGFDILEKANLMIFKLMNEYDSTSISDVDNKIYMINLETDLKIKDKELELKRVENNARNNLLVLGTLIVILILIVVFFCVKE
jgi:hypothetical protein